MHDHNEHHDYHSIWLYIPTSAIASDPIEAKATPEELSTLAFFSSMADDLARKLLKHSAAPEKNEQREREPEQEPGPGCGCSSSCLETIVIVVIGLAVILWWMSQYNPN